MDYAAARPQIRTGDLLAFSGGSLRSLKDAQVLAIRIVDWTPYTHVGIAWVVCGRVFIIHAIGRGVSIEPLSNQGSFYWLPLGLQIEEAALEPAFARIGEHYSKWQAILGFFRRLKIGADRAWQCAEWVIWFYRQVGHPLLAAEAKPSSVVQSALQAGRFLWWVEND